MPFTCRKIFSGVSGSYQKNELQLNFDLILFLTYIIFHCTIRLNIFARSWNCRRFVCVRQWKNFNYFLLPRCCGTLCGTSYNFDLNWIIFFFIIKTWIEEMRMEILTFCLWCKLFRDVSRLSSISLFIRFSSCRWWLFKWSSSATVSSYVVKKSFFS